MVAEDDVHRLARRHAEQFGSLDLLVLCARFGTTGPAGYSVLRFDRRVEVTYAPPFPLIEDCVPSPYRVAVLHPGWGARIVALASIAGVASESALACASGSSGRHRRHPQARTNGAYPIAITATNSVGTPPRASPSPSPEPWLAIYPGG